MNGWKLTGRKLKNYPHFDAPLSIAAATALVTDPVRVAAHSFFPFIRYVQQWRKYAPPRVSRSSQKLKTREIRYAARGDSYIYSYYRYLLSVAYEELLISEGLDTSILAYRSIKQPSGQGGKSNIHFARDAIDVVNAMRPCNVICLDIKAFFESLDHKKIYELWCRLLKVSRLSSDHYAVFRAITKYAVVDQEAVYTRLGYFGPKLNKKTGKTAPGYLVPKSKIPKQLCTTAEFRKKIAGGSPLGTAIETNPHDFGIPQGAPLSDLIANLYLIDFDKEINSLVTGLGGRYFRYSDDILVILPAAAGNAASYEETIRTAIKRHGSALTIQESKSSIYEFPKTPDTPCVRTKGTQGRNGFEYLGFRFDGRQVYLRDATLSSLYRKVAIAAWRHAIAHVARYPGKTVPQLKALFDHDEFVRKFGRVRDFDPNVDDFKNWTFWTYAQRANAVFKNHPNGILRQLKSHRSNLSKKIDITIEKAAVP